MKEKITYIKRCLNMKCRHKTECEHGKAQIRFMNLFPKGLEEIDYNMHKNFMAVYPVRNCSRWNKSKEELLILQNNQNLQL